MGPGNPYFAQIPHEPAALRAVLSSVARLGGRRRKLQRSQYPRCKSLCCGPSTLNFRFSTLHDQLPCFQALTNSFAPPRKLAPSLFMHLQTPRAFRKTSTPTPSITSELLRKNTRVRGMASLQTSAAVCFLVPPASCRPSLGNMALVRADLA